MLQSKVHSEDLLFLGSIDVVLTRCCRIPGRILLIPVFQKLGERRPTKSHALANMYTKPVYGMCADLMMGPFGRLSLPPSLALPIFPSSPSRSYLILRPTSILPRSFFHKTRNVEVATSLQLYHEVSCLRRTWSLSFPIFLFRHT